MKVLKIICAVVYFLAILPMALLVVIMTACEEFDERHHP